MNNAILVLLLYALTNCWSCQSPEPKMGTSTTISLPNAADTLPAQPVSPEENLKGFRGNVLMNPNNWIRLWVANPFGISTLSELQQMYPEFQLSGDSLVNGNEFIRFRRKNGDTIRTGEFSFSTTPGRFARGIREGMTPTEVLVHSCGTPEACVRKRWANWTYYGDDYPYPEEEADALTAELLENVERMGAISGDIEEYVKMSFEEGKLNVEYHTIFDHVPDC